MSEHTILIDTDCGVDDAIAIMLALGSERYSVAGISTLSGNVEVSRVTDNVLRLLAFLGREDIPVYVGASRPFVGPPRNADGIHGKNGLGGIELPKTDKKSEEVTAPQAIVHLAEHHPGLTIVTLGPLTNLAMALNLRPGLSDLIGRVVAMGGAVERGNVTQFAEFNFYADPESVQYVLGTGIPLEVLTWDASMRAAVPEEEISEITGEAARHGGRNSKAQELFGRLAAVLLDNVERLYGIRTAPLPDPLAMAYALEPDITEEHLSSGLMMELAHTVMRGASVLHEEGNAEIILNTDRNRFVNILKTHLARVGAG